MENVLDKIINKVDNKEQSETSNQKFEANFDVNPLKGNFLNNLDGIDEKIGTFDVKIFGIGGAGCNVIKYMKEARQWADNVKIYALNTDVTALKKICNISNAYLLGKKLLRGAGSGGDPLIGRSSIDEDREAIKQVLQGTDLLFLVAGLGKGTGSGATPEIAKIAKEMGILTVAIVNLPSVQAEGRTIYQNALHNLKELKNQVNSITTISNDLIIKNSGDDISFIKAFEKANQHVTTIVSEVTDMINNATEMNVDFADLRSFFKESPIFSANAFTLDEQYSLHLLANKIKTCIDKSYCDLNLENAQKVIVNLSINETIPNTIVADTRNIFKEITNNTDLSVVSGVDYTKLSGIKVSFLISAKDENANIATSIEENVIKFTDSTTGDDQQKLKFGDELNNIHNTSIILDEQALAQYKTGNTNKTFIDKETFDVSGDDENKIQQEADSYELNSNECVDIITKAMTSVLKTTSLDMQSIEKNKNN